MKFGQIGKVTLIFAILIAGMVLVPAVNAQEEDNYSVISIDITKITE